MQPSSVPNRAARAKPMAQSPPPRAPTESATRYCTTEAATVKEMSMPPAISTTSSPTPKMMLTALLLARSKMLGSVRNVPVDSPRPTTMARITRRSQRSVAPIGKPTRRRP